MWDVFFLQFPTSDTVYYPNMVCLFLAARIVAAVQIKALEQCLNCCECC